MKEFRIALYYGGHCSADAYDYIWATDLSNAQAIANARYPNTKHYVTEISNSGYNGCPMFT